MSTPNARSAAPAPGDSQPHRGTLGRLAKTTAAHAYKEADIRSANKSHGKRKSAAEKKAAQPQEVRWTAFLMGMHMLTSSGQNAEPHVCTGSGSERKGLPETEQTTDAPTDSDGTGTTASAATQVEQLAGSKRPREGADLRVSSSEPGKDVIILESVSGSCLVRRNERGLPLNRMLGASAPQTQARRCAACTAATSGAHSRGDKLGGRTRSSGQRARRSPVCREGARQHQPNVRAYAGHRRARVQRDCDGGT